MLSILTNAFGVFGTLALASLPYWLRREKTSRMRREIVELADVRDKLPADSAERSEVVGMIANRTTSLLDAMSLPRIYRWKVIGGIIGVGVVAVCLAAGNVMQQRADTAIRNYSRLSDQRDALTFEGAHAILKEPMDEATIAQIGPKLTNLTPALDDSLAAFHRDNEWAMGLNTGALVIGSVLLVVLVSTAAWDSWRAFRRKAEAQRLFDDSAALRNSITLSPPAEAPPPAVGS